MNAEQASLAPRSKEKLYFEHPDMDYYLAWVMGRQIYEGSESGECLETAARITNGNAESWQQEWLHLATKVEQEAQRAIAIGDPEKARKAYLRACTYYRAPLFIMRRNAALFDSTHLKMQMCFQKAAALFDPPIKSVEAPFEGHLLPGYFWKVDNSSQKRPTLIVFGGLETFAEDCYFMIWPCRPQRGYNVLAVDLPGQGLNPDLGLTFDQNGIPCEGGAGLCLEPYRNRWGAASHFGFSWGGHIVFKGAQHKARVKAMIANPAMPNVIRAALVQQQGHNRSDPIARTAFDQIVWRMGLKISFHPMDIARRFRKAYDYFVYGKADPRKITCPVLCLAGEGEAAITLKIAQECYEQLPHPHKKLVIFTSEEGGEAHCQVNNLALPNSVIFDWLDMIFA